MVTKQELQSLLGSLLYITKCVKSSRMFLNCMLQLLRDNTHKNVISLTQDFHKDLHWFNVFLQSYNEVTMYHITPLLKQMHRDASLQGLGGLYNNYVYALAIPLHFREYNIAHLEMVNVVVDLKIWGHLWANKWEEIRCDNRAVVDVLSFRRARDPVLATSARNVWLLSAMYNVTVVVSHIACIRNTAADLLSRWCGSRQDFVKLSLMG